jgi:glyoxylate/hydroxypyruvate reductase A
MKVAFCAPVAPPEKWLDALRRHLPQAEVSNWAPGAPSVDYAAVWHPPAQFFAEQTKIKAIFNLGAGVDGILRQTALPENLMVVRLEDAGMADQMFDYVLYAVLHYFRFMDFYGTHQAQSLWRERRRSPDRKDFVIGVMGLGKVGSVVAQGLAAQGFSVHGWTRSPCSMAGVQTHAGTDALPGFLAALDVVVNVLPQTSETLHLLDANRLAQIKPGAAVINVGRGATIDTNALVAALDGEHLRGAFLDVFETEPLPADSPLWRHPKVRITPHISARTLIDESVAQIAEKIGRLERGQAISGIVDRTRGY